MLLDGQAEHSKLREICWEGLVAIINNNNNNKKKTWGKVAKQKRI